MFKKAKQNRVFQDVVDQIEEAIVDGQLTPGEKLPAERQLKEMFNVSRGTLREALRVLEQKGLIEIRLGVGGGAIVKDVNSDQVSESLALLIRSGKVSIDHLAEFRTDMESKIAAIAAERCTEDDAEKLYALLDQAHDDLYEDYNWEAFLRTDESLHAQIAETTRNPLYETILHTVHENIHRYYETYLPREKALLEENFEDLKIIVNAITNSDPGTAAKRVKLHVSRFHQHMNHP